MSTPDFFEYKDITFGDTDGIVVSTRSKVFYPTSTTNLLLAGVRKTVDRSYTTALDLGCGSGIVAVVLAKRVLPGAKVYASDISEEAVQLAKENAAAHRLDIDCRYGSLFEPWEGFKFDLIVDDVAGMSEPIARMSPWYPPEIKSDAGQDGTRWIVKILSEAPEHLTDRGQIIFPVLTLSDEAAIMDTANTHFGRVEMISEQWYPLGADLLAHWEVIEDLMNRGMVTLQKRGSRWLWATKIFKAGND
jgi:methylase of polypeptide subunit release factors